MLSLVMFWACAIGRGSVGLPIGHAVRRAMRLCG